MSISNAMIESNDGGKPYMKEKNESKEKNKTRNEDKNEGKIIRVLEIYTRLLNGADYQQRRRGRAVWSGKAKHSKRH